MFRPVNTNLKDLILASLLKQHGFNKEDYIIEYDKITFDIKSVNRQEFGNEKEKHNYYYPQGIIQDIEKITVDYYDASDKKYGGRIRKITLPLEYYKNFKGVRKVEDLVATCNAIDDSDHRVEDNTYNASIIVDCSNVDFAKNLLNLLMTADFQPKIASEDDRKSHYVSDLGRLAPLLIPALQKEVEMLLCNRKETTSLRLLKDEVVNSPGEVKIHKVTLDKKVFDHKIEKLVREEGYLVNLLQQHLKFDERADWISADVDLLSRYSSMPNDKNAKKLAAALQNKNNAKDLFISATTGNHAFAIKVDFANKTLFLANPGIDQKNCEKIINKVKTLTGFNTVVPVFTIDKLKRDDEGSIQNTCTCDSLIFTKMMMEEKALSEGCFNDKTLQTDTYVREALGARLSGKSNDMPQDEKVPESPDMSEEESMKKLANLISKISGNTDFWQNKVGSWTRDKDETRPDGVKDISEEERKITDLAARLEAIGKDAEWKRSWTSLAEWFHSFFRSRHHVTEEYYQILSNLNNFNPATVSKVTKDLQQFEKNYMPADAEKKRNLTGLIDRILMIQGNPLCIENGKISQSGINATTEIQYHSDDLDKYLTTACSVATNSHTSFQSLHSLFSHLPHPRLNEFYGILKDLKELDNKTVDDVTKKLEDFVKKNGWEHSTSFGNSFKR